ncbi:germ cell nuclear acidic peptidase [Arctopsyche grandis]|uniref:germ cell nuclear acidic peptidase n=1 Tax=Arctopsyche grandis TaxID=121162 RepID=UPI00406D704D
MDHTIAAHTIARTPTLKKRFAKLCLKKNIKSCPPKSSKDGENFFGKNTEESNYLSPILNNEYISTPPFVTRGRPAPRKISSILFSSGTLSSNNSAAEAKLSGSKLFEGISSDTHSTPTISNKKDDSKDLENPLDYSNDKSGDLSNSVNDNVNLTPKCYSSPKREVAPDMVNLMDQLYGDVWRSTPGLFKKKKKIIPKYNDQNDNDLINELKSLNLSNPLDSNAVCDSNDNNDPNSIVHNPILEPGYVNADDNDSKIEFESNSIKNNSIDVIVINDTDSLSGKDDNSFNIPNEQNSIDSESKSHSKESLNLDESDFLHTTKKKITRKNPLFESSDSNDDIGVEPETNLLSGCDSENTKQNNVIIKDVVDKKKIPKKKTAAEKDDIKNIRSSKIPILTDNQLENIQQYGFMASLADNVPSWRREYKAKHYRDNFKKKKEELANILFKMFNENVFESRINPSVPIIWSSTLNKTAGRAHNKMVKSKGGSKDGSTISKRSHVELSIKVVDTAQRLRDTLAHELCHVATWLIDGQLHDQHGPYWKAWVQKVLHRYPEIGSLPVRHSLEIHFKYSYKCIKCGYKVDRHSKSIDTTKKRCGYCYGTLQCLLNKKTKDGLVVPTPVKQRSEVTGFALYVKENYSNVRSGSTPHKDAMKYLGRQYAKTKLLSKENIEP